MNQVEYLTKVLNYIESGRYYDQTDSRHCIVGILHNQIVYPELNERVGNTEMHNLSVIIGIELSDLTHLYSSSNWDSRMRHNYGMKERAIHELKTMILKYSDSPVIEKPVTPANTIVNEMKIRKTAIKERKAVISSQQLALSQEVSKLSMEEAELNELISRLQSYESKYK